MTTRSEQDWSLDLALNHGSIWALLAIPASILAFLLSCIVASTTGSEAVLNVLLFAYVHISQALLKHDLIGAENLPGAIMIGQIIPWMFFGFLFGVIRGWRITSDTFLNQRGFRIFSLIADLTVLLLGSFMLWW